MVTVATDLSDFDKKMIRRCLDTKRKRYYVDLEIAKRLLNGERLRSPGILKYLREKNHMTKKQIDKLAKALGPKLAGNK